MLLPTIRVSIWNEDTGEKYIDEIYICVERYIHEYEKDELIIEYEGGTAVISNEDFDIETNLKTIIEVIS